MFKSIFLSIFKTINPLTIFGWIFPKTIAQFQAWQSNKTPENILALGETAANELASDFDPALLPELTEYESDAAPAIVAIIEAVEHPGVTTDEVAITSAIVAYAKARKSSVDPAKLTDSVATICQLINEAIPGA